MGLATATPTHEDYDPDVRVDSPDVSVASAHIPGSPHDASASMSTVGSRSQWKSVALPSEHGGWGLTLEPAVLGLIVKPTWSGFALGLAAMVAFVARTPVKLALVDFNRKRTYDRTRLALKVAACEALVLAALFAWALFAASAVFWWPLAIAAPLLGLELWFGMRSRSRRLIPEMAGTIGIGSVAAAIILAGGGSTAMALGAWLVVIARATASVPFSRLQVRRFKGHDDDSMSSDSLQFLALAAVLVGWQVGWLPGIAPVAVAVLGVLQFVMVRKRPPRAAILGVQQMFVGLAVVVATAVGMTRMG